MSRIRLAALALTLSVLVGGGLGALASPAEDEERHPELASDVRLAGPQRQTGLPKTHGQASWSPGERRAPNVSLRDHNGRRVSLASLRQDPVLLTFLDSQCQLQCPAEGRQLGMMLDQMRPGERPAVVIVSVNPSGDTPASIRHAMKEWRFAGAWRWHWLRGTRAELSRVWRDYGITVEPRTNDIVHGMALFLIDRRGFERTAYAFPFLPNFVGRDLRALAREQS